MSWHLGARWWWHPQAMTGRIQTRRHTIRPRCRTTSSSPSGRPLARMPCGEGAAALSSHCCLYDLGANACRHVFRCMQQSLPARIWQYGVCCAGFAYIAASSCSSIMHQADFAAWMWQSHSSLYHSQDKGSLQSRMGEVCCACAQGEEQLWDEDSASDCARGERAVYWAWRAVHPADGDIHVHASCGWQCCAHAGAVCLCTWLEPALA